MHVHMRATPALCVGADRACMRVCVLVAAVARLLGNPRLADWKTCLPQPAPGERASTQELEQRLADDFKSAFAVYDPTAEDE